LYANGIDLPNDPELLADLRRLRTKISAGSSQVIVPRVGRSDGDRGQALAIGCLKQAQFGILGRPGDIRGGGSPLTAGFLRGRGDVEGETPGLPHQSLTPPSGWHTGRRSIRDEEF
jgi:hypothetical protein